MSNERAPSEHDLILDKISFEREMRKLDQLIRENDFMNLTEQQESELREYRKKQLDESEKQWQAFRERVVREMKEVWGKK